MGDHLQLPPLLQTAYPAPATGPELATGIMQSLLRNANNERVDYEQQVPYLRALKEQRRMCEELSEATQRLYGFAFDLCSTRFALMNGARRCVVVPAASGMSYETELQQQAELVEQQVSGLLAELAHSLDLEHMTEPAVFVIAPHKAQRSRVQQRLHGLEGKVRVDTVDRMQGSECFAAVLCYSFLDVDRVESEMDFIFDLQRINVALSRAKWCTVLVASDTVLQPSLTVLTTRRRRAAFEHLRNFFDSSRVQRVMDVSE